jgi:hypothetical protein
MPALTYLRLVCIVCLSFTLSACSDEPEPEVYEYNSIRSHCDPLIIAIKSGDKLTITTTGEVITNPNGVVEDCDFWTDADGIPGCHYVDQRPDLHGLPFMALIGFFDEEYFLVGTNFTRTFDSDGNLELSVNDWGGCGEDSDNEGTFVITVLIE